MTTDLNVIKKFWNSTEKTDFCWNWKGELSNGQPILSVGRKGNRKRYNPRKISALLAGKELFENKRIKNFCKNKLCINPDHLILGDEERFWSKVQKLSNPNDCWVWIGRLNKDMYGYFHLKRNDKNINTVAHAYSWELRNGISVPKNMIVCHKCDHPYCVNPDHLFLGTHQDNSDDKVYKGRQYSKLNPDKIKEIISLYPEIKVNTLSAIYNVSQSNIYKILQRKIWSHVK